MDGSNNHLSAGTWPNGQNISNPTFISMTTDTVTSNQNLNPITTNSHSSNQKESSPDKLQESMIRKGASPTPIKNNHKSYAHTHPYLLLIHQSPTVQTTSTQHLQAPATVHRPYKDTQTIINK